MPIARHARPRRSVTRAMLAALAAGALVLSACSDGDDDTEDADPASEQDAADTAGTSAGNGDGGAGSSADGADALVGTWSPPSGREQTFTADGEFFVAADGEVLAEGTWTATPTTVELVPGSGAIACDQPGSYEWEVEGDTLTFTVVEDPCTGRREGMNGVPRQRVETTSTSSAADSGTIEGEFHAVDPGVRTIDTLGVPLELELTGEWWVQPNHDGFTVVTHPDSRGPGDRDVVFIRPTALVEPDRLNDSAEDVRAQDGWPLPDIDGWLERVPPGLVDGEPVDTTLGGRDAIRFDVEPTNDFDCGPDGCAGFVTNDWMDNIVFEHWQRWTVWWVDGGDHDPLVVLVGRDPEDTEWLGTAEALLATVELGEPGPHPAGER